MKLRWESQDLTNKIKKKIKIAGIITVQEKMMPTHPQQDGEAGAAHHGGSIRRSVLFDTKFFNHGKFYKVSVLSHNHPNLQSKYS